MTTQQQPLSDPELAVALLNEINLKPVAQNEAFAQQHPYERIRRCVSHWWLGRKSLGGIFLETPGIVRHWLLNWDTSSIPPLHPDFYATDLFHRFRPQAELAAENLAEQNALRRLRQLRRQPQVLTVPEPATALTSVTDRYASAWHDLLAELQQSMPGAIYATFVAQNLTLVHAQEPGGPLGAQLTLTINIHRHHTADWVKRQLAQRLQRSLKVILKQDLTINFQP